MKSRSPELSVLLDAAALLHPLHRPRFLATAAEELMRTRSLDAPTVRAIVHDCLHGIDLWPPPPRRIARKEPRDG